jgi:circadian clock protein KaiB
MIANPIDPTTTADESPQPCKLRLYITGMSPRSIKAIELLKVICNKYFQSTYELEVIDIYQQPQLCKQDQIMVAPTLIRLSPGPVHRLVGSIDDEKSILNLLNYVG